MLKLAGVTANDFVIDLGSGDGRVILTAAQKFKAHGLGVDIDEAAAAYRTVADGTHVGKVAIVQ